MPPGNYHFFFSLITAALARQDIQKPVNLTASPGLVVDFEEHSFLRVGSSTPRESREKPTHNQDLRYDTSRPTHCPNARIPLPSLLDVAFLFVMQ